MPNKIILPKREQNKYFTRSEVVRVDSDIIDQIGVLSYQTNMSMKDIASILLRDALSRVELVERKIYELRMHSDQEEQEGE